MRPRDKLRARSAAPPRDTDSHAPRPHPLRLFLPAAAGTLVAVAASAALWNYWPTPTAALDPSTDARDASQQPSPSRQPELAARHPGPAIRLATAPLEVPAEQLQRETEAIGRELLARFPQLPEALHVAAMMHAQLRQTASAEKLWQRCVELAPHTDQYRVNLAAVAMDRGNNELAAKVLEPAGQRPDASPDVSHHLGMALSNLGRGDEAEQILTAALERFPQSAAHWLVLGQAQLKLGKAAESEASLRKAHSLGLASADLYFALGNACAQQGKADEAAEFRRQFASLQAAAPLAPGERFQVLSSAEARRTAVTVMVEAATVHAWQEDSLEAERLLLRAIAIDPASIASCRKLAEVYEQGGLAAERRAVVERLVQIEPLHLMHYLDLARLAAELDDPAAAEAALKQAISVAPDNAAPYTTLAQFYLQGQRAKTARWYAQEAVRRDPTPEGYTLLASTCRLVGDAATAEAALAEAQRLSAANAAPATAAPRPEGRQP